MYVTGVPGAGKSAVRRELRKRGVVAYGTDEDHVAAFFDASGAGVPANEVVDSAAWRSRHTWKIAPERLDELAAGAGRVFLCGSAANEGEVWDRFAAVVALVVDEPTMLGRLAERTDNSFGKSPDERAKAIGWRRGYAEAFRSYGATLIDAAAPIEFVVESLLSVTANPRALTTPRKGQRLNDLRTRPEMTFRIAYRPRPVPPGPRHDDRDRSGVENVLVASE